MDKILEPTNTTTLKNAGFSPLLPQEVKARRTIICYRVDDIAFENSSNDIADEIEQQQDWASIQDIFKFPNTTSKRNILKIEFDSVAMADKAHNHGFKLFNVSIPPHQIQKERYIKVDFCMKCYSIEDHTTR